MGRPDVHSLTGGAGLIAMLAWLIAYPVGLGLPGVDAPRVAVAAFAADHQSALVAFAVLIAIGATLLIGFLVGLHQLLRGAQQVDVLASIGLVGSVVAQVLVIIGAVFAADEAFTRGVSPDEPTRSNLLLFLFFTISAWPTILGTFAFGLALVRSPRLPRIAAWLAFATAVVHVGSGVSLAPSGPLSPSGPIAEAAPAVFMVWVVVVSISVLINREHKLVRNGATAHVLKPLADCTARSKSTA